MKDEEGEISYNKLQRIKKQMADIEEGKDVANVKSAIDNETYNHELMRDFKLPTGEIMLGRIRYSIKSQALVACHTFTYTGLRAAVPPPPGSWHRGKTF